jgi:hypothetical protein
MIGWVQGIFESRHSRRERQRDATRWDISPDDRIGVLPKRSRGPKAVRRGAMLTGLVGIAYASYQDPAIVARSWSLMSPLLSKLSVAEFGRGAARTPEAPSPARMADMPLPAQTAPSPMPDFPGRIAGSSPAVADEAAEPKPDKAVDTPAKSSTALLSTPPRASVPYAPPEKVTVDDPFELKAKASGLSPDLSRALLAELSDVDYRNARVAIETALLKTPDDAVLRWPRKREGGLAIFEVKFVQGAPDSCRRYIVTIEKNRWLTTSLPVEKCGIAPVKRHAASTYR